jgi:hypothetical protein
MALGTVQAALYAHHDAAARERTQQRESLLGHSANGGGGSSPTVSSSRVNGSVGSHPQRRSLADRCCLLGERCLDGFVKLIGPVLTLVCLSMIALVTRAYFVEVLPLLSARVCHAASDDTIRRYFERSEFHAAELNGRQGIQDARSGRFIIADPRQGEQGVQRMLDHHAALLSSVWTDTTPCAETYTITAFGLYLLFNLLFHYFATMFLGPGRPPARLASEVEDHLAAHDPEVRRDEGQRVRSCKTCRVVKPMRAHHCRACGQCSLKMDHRTISP